MADAAVLATAVVTSFLQGVKALRDASVNLEEAPSNLRNLKRLVKQVEEALAKAQLRYSNKLHNEEFRGKLQELSELLDEFKAQVEIAQRLIEKRGASGIRRLLTCCWSAAVGDELQRIAYSIESELQTWLEQQSLPHSIDEAMERYAQGLPSYLTLQPEDGYQPLQQKSKLICDLLENNSRKVVLVHGLSGVGKSSLAHYVAANSLPKLFSDGSTKLLLGYGCSRAAAGNNTQEYQKVLTEKIIHLLRTQLGYKKQDIDEVDLRRAFTILEETLRGKSYLVIVDDAWETDIVVRFMKLQGNQCKFLVTSRLYSIVSTDEAYKVELTKDDVAPVGKEILRYHSKLAELPEHADVLLERCGFHPFTLTVIGQALEGETRQEQWLKAINELSVYANRASVPSNYLIDDEISNAATVFGSLEFSLRAMEQDSRELFISFSTIAWVEPIPEACLEELWGALGLKGTGTFRLALNALLKGSLIGKHKSSYSYIIHDMVALYLNEKQSEGLTLLKFPDARKIAAVAPWLYRYGKERPKKEAADAVVTILRDSRNGEEVLQTKIFEATINISAVCRNHQDWTGTSKLLVHLLAPQIPRIIPGLQVGGATAQSIIRFITTFFAFNDWEYNFSSFIDTGILQHLRPLLQPGFESLQSTVHVVMKLARLIPVAEDAEETLRNMPIIELVRLLDPASRVTRNFVGHSVMKALVVIAEVGGQIAVERMFSAGLGEMIVEQVVSDYREFSGSGMKELNLLRLHYLEGGSLILDRFLQSGFLNALPGDAHREYFNMSLIMV